MRTFQLTLDENIIKDVDRYALKNRISRSAFTRQALLEALNRVKEKTLEAKHRMGYVKEKGKKDEFAVWHDQQSWGDE